MLPTRVCQINSNCKTDNAQTSNKIPLFWYLYGSSNY